MPKETKAVILAAGSGTRMKSRTPKVLHMLCGRPMVQYMLDATATAGINDIICVIPHKADMIKRLLKDVDTIVQKRPLGSGDALNQAKHAFKNFTGDILVLCADTPLIKPETIKRLGEEHKKGNNFCTVLTAVVPDPAGYGRIVRDNAAIIGIKEETEASTHEKAIKEINAGAYCFEANRLFSLIAEIKNNNRKKEYFLTDIISLGREKNLKIGSAAADDADEVIGINSRKDLARANKALQRRIVYRIMDNGVTVIDPDSTYIDRDAEIGKDTIIYPNTIIAKDTKIGRACKIGPFARIRSGCSIKEKVKIGNFVELTRTKIGSGTKVMHKTYLGDAVIGKNVNIGAGTITANYDGRNKNVTKISDGAFIGVGTILIAPVKVGKNAITGAGAVIPKNHNVPPNTVVAGVPARVLKKKQSGY